MLTTVTEIRKNGLLIRMFLLFSGFFSLQITKMMELMEQDAQLKKGFFFFILPLLPLACIYDALNALMNNGLFHLFL